MLRLKLSRYRNTYQKPFTYLNATNDFGIEIMADDDDEICQEEILKKVRARVKKRQEMGAYNDSATLCLPAALDECDIKGDLSYIYENWDIQNKGYIISSHRPLMGTVLVKGRELVSGEFRRYIDPVLLKQSLVNAAVFRTIEAMDKRQTRFAYLETNLLKGQLEATKELDVLREDIEKVRGGVQEDIEKVRGGVQEDIEKVRREVQEDIEKVRREVQEDIEKVRGGVQEDIEKVRGGVQEDIEKVRGGVQEDIEKVRREVQEDIEERVMAVVAAMNEEIEARASLLKVLEKKVSETPIDTAECSYFVFEERFRGSREEIMKRQSVFLRHFTGCKNVLDIGCGRGEFLELLRTEGIGSYGIDVDEDMVNYCRSRGLCVERIDAISYLQEIEDKGLDGVFLDQVVEHLENEYLMKVLRLSYQKMIYGSYIVAETVNPLSFTSFANFYIDMSHKKPLHPQTLSYLFESAGFREVRIEFHSPLPDYARLEAIPPIEYMDGNIKNISNIYNSNIDKLNKILYGPQDYVVIGKK